MTETQLDALKFLYKEDKPCTAQDVMKEIGVDGYPKPFFDSHIKPLTSKYVTITVKGNYILQITQKGKEFIRELPQPSYAEQCDKVMRFILDGEKKGESYSTTYISESLDMGHDLAEDIALDFKERKLVELSVTNGVYTMHVMGAARPFFRRNTFVEEKENQSKHTIGEPSYSDRQKVLEQSHLAAKNVEIKKYLNTTYVNGKINTMTEAVNKNTDLAIGTAKELLETVCKSILKQKSVAPDTSWTLSQLLKQTSNSLDFTPKEADDPTKAEQSIKQILGGVSSIVQGVTELRNAYGTGHGKDAAFKGLESKYAKLLVGVVSEIAIFFLATNGETAELVEINPL